MTVEIEKIRELQNQNFEISKNALGDSWGLGQDLLELYESLSEIIKDCKVKISPEEFTSLSFFLGSQYQLVMGCLAILSGNLSDSFQYTRKAIELSAFAARVKRHPHLAEIWQKADDNDDAYEEYRKKFSPGKLFSEDNKILGDLYTRYDECSKITHSSIVSLAQNVEINETEKGIETSFQFFGVRADDHSEPARTYLWTIDTHFKIIQIFEDVFSNNIKPDLSTWEIRRNTMEAKLAVHKERWKPIVDPNS